ncbi:metallophosphoesterase family protein [Bacillus sp. FJAT-45350]|uniref:metallophosphoesterase family protein n=1 Tax=Bacillus sp. FJAT-45350 TaxID=2011014 RepID=UPI000BB76BDD|nr:metallophosphoesterase [Bacillus sp. FJAT-45350]
MKLVVISDTHIPKRAKGLPSKLIADLKDAELIIHAGDWQTVDIYHELATYGELKGVIGNVDNEELQRILPESLVLEVNNFRIGVVHGHGKGLTTEKRALATFKEQNVDCIIFGHSHIPVNKMHEGILLFNPGSATDKRRQAQYSYGVLTLNEEISAQHVFYDEKH